MKTQSSLLKSAQTRAAILARYEESGLSQDEFAQFEGINPRTLRKWLKRYKDQGMAALGDRRAVNSGRPGSVMDTQLAWVLSYISKYPKAPLTRVHEELDKVCIREGWARISYHAMRRAYVSTPYDLRIRLREGHKAVFEKASPVGMREEQPLLGMAQIDSSEADFWCLDMETGAVFKPWLTGVIEARSRVIMGIRFHRRPPTGEEIVATVRDAFLPKSDPARPFWGTPRILQSDNASIFCEGELPAALGRMNVIHSPIPVNCPGANGKIERFFGTFHERLCKTLQGYSGQHGAKRRAEVRGAIPWPIIDSVAKRFIAAYHTTVHSSLEITPWEAWHQALDMPDFNQFDEGAILDGAKISASAKVTREGVILNGKSYNGPSLVGLVKEEVDALLVPCEVEKSVEIFHRGHSAGKVSLAVGSDEINSAINELRLSRQKQLSELSKKLRENLEQTPVSAEPPALTKADVEIANVVDREIKFDEFPEEPAPDSVVSRKRKIAKFEDMGDGMD